MPHSSAPTSFSAHLRRFGWALADALLYGNGLVAASAAALTAASAYYWRQRLPWTVPALVFAATLLVYNLNGTRRYRQQLPPGVPARRRWIVQHRVLLTGVVSASAVVLVALYVAMWLRNSFAGQLTWFLGHLALLSLAYSWPVLPGRHGGRRRGLRDVPVLKTLLIGYVWAAVTVWLPAICTQVSLLSPAGGMLLARRFCFILAVALVFDLRDYSKDRQSGTPTLPVLLGFQRGRWLALACVLASAALLLPGLSVIGQLVLAVPTLLSALVTWFADETRSDYYFALLADGLLLLQAAALVAATLA
ncbi:UbiA family prenyltransferase [Hymenobacter koreensis]|uniref:UbiA family prenyltransferase n=1 Tax=Hymenobacter koreensis TaxID=1084523 RepID=A0ABP8IXA0_9BACT